MTSLFLSYRRADSPATVKEINERLRSRLPLWSLFYDHTVLLPGEILPDRLRDEVSTADVVAVVIGPRWLDSLKERRDRPEVDHVRALEVRLALSSGRKVIPLLVENARMPSEGDLADFPDLQPLCRLIGQAIRPDPDFDQDLERLATYLDRLGPGVGRGTVLGGKYKILREISQGGMGIVYEGEQQQPSRIVAIKMILEGMDSKEVLARFDGEKEALARMDHPNVARVIDSGASPGGKPYFVMEFVRGEPITTYCDRKRLSPKERLKLLRLVCAAVQHAHQKGIIHRDIKPSNVLVEEIDGDPVPKVIDFGLAKALAGRLTDKTLVSETGKAVGTLIYASPEQATGRQYDVDTRTDVYSLGAVLYELLAGVPPFTEERLRQVGDEAMRREIIENEPSKPSATLSSSNALPLIAANRQLEPRKLTRLVRGELDWIAMRALEKEPQRRYETASQFSDDIDRYLNNEPVKAGKPSTFYRVKKLIRRNRIPVLAGMLVFAALLAGVVGTSLGLREARRQEGIAKNEAHEKNIALEHEEVQRKLAEQRFAEKREAMDQILERFSDKRLNSLPNTQQIRQALFARGVEQYEDLFRENRNDRNVQGRLSDLYIQQARLQSEIGTLKEALEPLKKGEKALRDAVKREPGRLDNRFRLGVVLYQMGYCFWEHSQAEASEPYLREAIAILTALLEGEPANRKYALYVALAQTRLAGATKSHAERLKVERAAYDSLKRLAAEQPDDNEVRTALARATCNRGLDAAEQFKDAEAESLLDESRSLLAKAIEADPHDPVAFAAYRTNISGLAKVYRRTNRLAKAVEIQEQAVDDLTKQARANPAVTRYQEILAFLHDELHKSLLLQHQNDKAVQALREALRISQSLADRHPENAEDAINVASHYVTLANLLKAHRRETEALECYDTLIQQADRMMKAHPESSLLLQNLVNACRLAGVMLVEQDQQEKGTKAYQAGVDLYGHNVKTIKAATPELTLNYCQCCRALLDIAKQNKDAGRALEIGTRLILPLRLESFDSIDSKRELLEGWQSISDLQADEGRYAEALGLSERVYGEAKKLLGNKPRANWYLYLDYLVSYIRRATLYRKTGDERKEFDALRGYFAEFQPYVEEKDNRVLLKETESFTQMSLARLREKYDEITKPKADATTGYAGHMLRFTVPVDFLGTPYPFNVYVTGSWTSLEDQFAWVEKVRGGKVPAEVIESFRKLYKIAKDNNVAWQDLCVYALGTATGQPAVGDSPLKWQIESQSVDVSTPDNQLINVLSTARAELLAQKASPPARRKYASRLIKRAEAEVNTAHYVRAEYVLQQARGALDLDSLGRLVDPKNGDVFAHLQLVFGSMLAARGELAKGYSAILDGRRVQPSAGEPAFALEPGRTEFALGWISDKLKHPVEAIAWYEKAIDLGSNAAAVRLFEVVAANPDTRAVLSSEQANVVARALRNAQKGETAASAFARLLADRRAFTAKTTTLDSRRRLLLDSLRAAEDQPADKAVQRLLGSSYLHVGDSLVAIARPTDAIYYFQKAVGIRERLAKDDPKDGPLQLELSIGFNKLGLAASSAGKLNESVEYYRKGLRIDQERFDADRQNPEKVRGLFICHYNLGFVEEKRLDYAAAIASYQRALAIATEHPKPDSIAKDVAELKKRLAEIKKKKDEPKSKNGAASSSGPEPGDAAVKRRTE